MFLSNISKNFIQHLRYTDLNLVILSPTQRKKSFRRTILFLNGAQIYILHFRISKFTAIYFADKEFLVNRVSYPCTFSEKNAPSNHYSIQAEITYSPESNIANMSDEAIIQHVLDGLKERSLIQGKVTLVDLKRVPESYVVYDVGYENHAKIIRDYFTQIGIDLLGRFSYFEYDQNN